jgi:hypothetical protein
MKFREQLTMLDKSSGMSLVGGQWISVKRPNMEFDQKKITITHNTRSDMSFISADERVKFTFPLSTVTQPTPS